MSKSWPYHCIECLDEENCGYYGKLMFEGQPIEVCNHHDDLGPVPMVPVREARPDEDVHVGDRTHQ